jgi:L,D-transpeptidase catalytic domain
VRLHGIAIAVLALLAGAVWAGCSSQDVASVTVVTPSVTTDAAPAPPSTQITVPAAKRTEAAATAKVPETAPKTAAPVRQADAQPPQSGRWIDVDVTRYVVKLMDGQTVVRSIGPVAVGVQIDTGAYLSTATGLFHVYSKTQALTYDPPYSTYISDWVGFDPQLDNGFHSFLKDKDGHVVDASTGRISNGCIRTSQPEVIFAFAEIGMPVYVHT